MSHALTSKNDRFWISLIATILFALLQIIFISDSPGFSFVLFQYRVINLARIVVSVGWLGFGGIELRWRMTTKRWTCPAYSIVGGLFLLAFFVPSTFVLPILETMPAFCGVTQMLEWKTSKGKFILVFNGTGTADHHRFSTGYLNWTGNEAAGVGSLRLNPIQFQFGYDPYYPGTPGLLHERLAGSGLSDTVLSRIEVEIWKSLEMANSGERLGEEVGNVGAVSSFVANSWDKTIGGVTWLCCLFLAFQITGVFSIQQHC